MTTNQSEVERILQERRENRGTVLSDFDTNMRNSRTVVTLVTIFSEIDQALDDLDVRFSVTTNPDRQKDIEHSILHVHEDQVKVVRRLQEELPKVDAFFIKEKVSRCEDVLSILPQYLRLLIPRYEEAFEGSQASESESESESESSVEHDQQLTLGDMTSTGLDRSLAEREAIESGFKPVTDAIPRPTQTVSDPDDLSELEIDRILNSRK